MILCTDTVLLNYTRVNNDPDNFYNMKKLSAESEEYSETENCPLAISPPLRIFYIYYGAAFMF